MVDPHQAIFYPRELREEALKEIENLLESFPVPLENDAAKQAIRIAITDFAKTITNQAERKLHFERINAKAK